MRRRPSQYTHDPEEIKEMICFLDRLYGGHQEVSNGQMTGIAPPLWTKIVAFDEIECTFISYDGKKKYDVLIPGEYMVGKIEHAFILPLTSADKKPDTKAVNINSIGVDWRGTCKKRTIRELALKSVELSTEIDGDRIEDMADTLIRHWRFGADAFNLPMLAYSDDPEESEKECSLNRYRLKKMPDDIRAKLATWFQSNLPHTPKYSDYNPCIVIKKEKYVLIDLVGAIDWAVFVPASVITRKRKWYII